jgi:hypothetical protein
MTDKLPLTVKTLMWGEKADQWEVVDADGATIAVFDYPDEAAFFVQARNCGRSAKMELPEFVENLRTSIREQRDRRIMTSQELVATAMNAFRGGEYDPVEIAHIEAVMLATMRAAEEDWLSALGVILDFKAGEELYEWMVRNQKEINELREKAVAEEREACAALVFQWQPETPGSQDDLSRFGPPDAVADAATKHITEAIRARR